MSCGCKSGLQKKPAAARSSHTASPTLQRAATKEECQCEDCKRARLQRFATQARTTEDAPPIVYEVLRSAGQPLEASTRSFMEERLGHDFSRVRIHTDARAAESARAVNARAYAVGRDVVFASGQYEPPNSDGLHLLAHELAHVRHARGERSSGKLAIDPSPTSGEERSAERAANDVLAGRSLEPADARASTSTVHRQAMTPLPHSAEPTRPPLYFAKPTRPPLSIVKSAAPPAVEVIEKEPAKKVAASNLRKRAWRLFIKAAANKYSVALIITLSDDFVPVVGLLTDLGLAGWMVWDIITTWNEIQQEAERLGEAENFDDLEVPDLDVTNEQVEQSENDKMRECKKEHVRNTGRRIPMNCTEIEGNRDSAAKLFMRRAGYNVDRSKAVGWKWSSTRGADKTEGIRDCGYASGQAWHWQVEERHLGGGKTLHKQEYSAFECDCCDAAGKARTRWVITHASPGKH